MKKIIVSLLILSCLSAQAESADQLHDAKSNMSKFEKAVKAFENRLHLWQRCIKRENCSSEDRAIAKSDLKKAAIGVSVTGVALLLTLTPVGGWAATKSERLMKPVVDLMWELARKR